MSDQSAINEPKPKRRLLRFGLGSLILVLLSAPLYGPIARWLCFARPPVMAKLPPIHKETVRVVGGRREIGQSWLAKRDGLLRMELKGDAFSLGFSNSALAKEYIKVQEDEFLATIQQHIPSKALLWLIGNYVLIRNRRLPEFISQSQREEIYGASLGIPDPHPELGIPHYHRILNYHAAHDIAHAVLDASLIGCTSFAAWGQATADGHLLMARNFDFSAGRSFDINKIVMRFKPDHGLGFVSVAWPGMIGVVSGINDARIAATVNAGHSKDSRSIGTPIALVLRRVMQNAKTMDEAVAIIREAEVFVADSVLIADGKTGRAVVMEKTPLRWALRETKGDTLVCANHYLSPTLKDDPANLAYMKEGTSVPRFERMKALVKAARGRLTPSLAVTMLRDRALPEGAGGLGNEASINMMAATHAVVIDVTAGVIWVSKSPHQLGAFVPFGLDDFEHPEGAKIIPADPALADGSYAKLEECRALLAKGTAARKEGRREDARGFFESAAAKNPGFYLPLLQRGRVSLELGKTGAAIEFLGAAQKAYPPFASERALIKRLLAKARKQESP